MSPADLDDLEALRRIDGVDVAVGLEAMDGQFGLYRRLLARFVQTHEPDVQAWQGADAAGSDPVAQHRRAHSLRGAAATLGLINIDESARLLEMALREQAPETAVRPLMLTLAKALDDGILALRRVPGVAAALAELERGAR